MDAPPEEFVVADDDSPPVANPDVSFAGTTRRVPAHIRRPTMQRTVVGMTRLAALIGAGCAPKAYHPFRIPADEFRRRVKTIAVANVAISSELGERAAVQAKFNPAIEGRLREAGFTVIAAQEFQATWDAKVNELGGLFDQNTGQVNEAKATALLNYIRAEMKTRFNADALLLPRVRPVTAKFSYIPFVGVRANWDGASEAL